MTSTNSKTTHDKCADDNSVAPIRSVRNRLTASSIQLNYDDRQIFDGLNVSVPNNKFTAIIGPNGCGKSTLLRTLCRLIKPDSGQVVLDDADINSLPPKELAQQLGLLPQHVHAPDGIRVKDLVSRGRFPYQQMFRQWSLEDEKAVIDAMALTNVSDLAERLVDELSGGQRQRVWIAMVLAQNTPILFLDEPTTYLDIAHQVDVLELCRDLNRNKNHTIVAVLHELNHAFRYADHVILMKNGQIVAEGDPQEMISEQIIEQVFDLKCILVNDPISNSPLVVPAGRQNKPNTCSK